MTQGLGAARIDHDDLHAGRSRLADRAAWNNTDGTTRVAATRRPVSGELEILVEAREPCRCEGALVAQQRKRPCRAASGVDVLARWYEEAFDQLVGGVTSVIGLRCRELARDIEANGMGPCRRMNLAKTFAIV